MQPEEVGSCQTSGPFRIYVTDLLRYQRSFMRIAASISHQEWSGDMVVMSIEQYDRMRADAEIHVKLKEAEFEARAMMQDMVTRGF